MLLILLFVPFLGFSQEIEFDYFIEIQRTRIKPKNTEIPSMYYFINTKTGEKFNVKKNKDKLMLSLYDSERDLLHYFNVYGKQGNYKIIYADSYTYKKEKTQDVAELEMEKDSYVKIIKHDDLSYMALLYRKKKSKRPDITVITRLEKSEFNFFSPIFIDDIAGDEIYKKLIEAITQDERHCFLKEYKVIYRKSGYQFLYNIVNIEKTDLKIVLPEKLDIKSL